MELITNNFYRKVDNYDLIGNRIFSSINPQTYGCFQSDSTITGITAHNTFGITNLKSNLTRNYTTYDLDTFNHILLDHSATDRNKCSIWCGRADQTGWGYNAFIARFADTSQVGMKELMKQKESLFLYPNPVHDILNIKIPCSINKKTICQISIYSSSGQLMYWQQHFSNTLFHIDISAFPKGFYSCIILNENNLKSNNFIVY